MGERKEMTIDDYRLLYICKGIIPVIKAGTILGYKYEKEEENENAI